MEMRYMTYKNEEGQKERFYPITHKDAIVGLSDIPEMSGNDLISTEAASEIVGDAPEIDPAIIDLVNSLTAEDIGARPDTWMPTASDVGAVAFKDLNNLDLNTITYAVCGYAYSCTNRPEGSNGYFECIPIEDGSRCLQRFTPYGEVTQTRQLYTDGTWSDWTTAYLPLTGGTLSDTLDVERMNGSTKGKLRLFPQNRTVNGKDAVTIGYSIDDVSKAFLAFNETGIQLCNRTNYKDYNIFGEHNKPSGSYTGNGSATKRYVEVGGSGYAILIRKDNSNSFIIVTTEGALIKNGASVSAVSNDEAYWYAPTGTLQLTSANVALNESGKTYYYCVL